MGYLWKLTSSDGNREIPVMAEGGGDNHCGELLSL